MTLMLRIFEIAIRQRELTMTGSFPLERMSKRSAEDTK